VRVQQVQLDELFALLSAVKHGEVSEADASSAWSGRRSGSGSRWTLRASCCWRSTWASARSPWLNAVVHHITQVLAPDCAPLFLTDGFREYMTALLTHYGYWVQSARQRARGPAPKPRWIPLLQLLYAQVIKTVRRRHLVRVSHRVVFGTREAVQQVLAACGWQINTAFIERVNLSIRQHVAAVGRRVSTLCKGEEGLQQQLVLYQVYYNFCLAHASLRLPLLDPEPTKGNGSAKRWQPQTPALAAGLTDHVWTLREVLLFRVPPWPQPAGL
jgi:hypothetical protein